MAQIPDGIAYLDQLERDSERFIGWIEPTAGGGSPLIAK